MNGSMKRWTLPAAIAVLVAACGGGGGSSGGQTTTSTGSMKTMQVSGVISGFGSVIVNGVHYDTSKADVRIEGKPATADQLRVGEVIHMTAEVDAKGNATAKVIDQQRQLQGTVQAVDLTLNTVTVAGQVVLVDNATIFDAAIASAGLAGIAVGDRIEVHGLVDSSGQVHATRIEKAAADDQEVEITGVVSALDGGLKRFTLGTQVVDYTAATLEGFGANGIADGDLVEVQGTTFLSDGALQAVKVSAEDDGFDGAQGQGGELEGMITRFASPTDFDVAGQKVTTTGTTVFVGGTAADLALDVKVEVEGTVDANGVLVADKVVLKHEASLKFQAQVDAVDTTAGTLQLLGLTVVVDNNTAREDHEMDNHFFSLADVHVGDWVEVSGYVDPAGSGKVFATSLERQSPENAVELRGPADALALPQFAIAGVAIQTTTATQFGNGSQVLDQATFFTQAVGQVVDVEGSWDGTSVAASRAEIDSEQGDH